MKNKKRKIFVISLLIIFITYMYVVLRGEYLETIGIGNKYNEVFKTNLNYGLSIFAVCFSIIYAMTYITTVFIKKGLKKFFVKEKKEMPKLPNKSISFGFGIILGTIFSNLIKEKAILALNHTLFGITDPIFNLDIGYYIFQRPFIQACLISFIVTMVMLSIYTIAYYLITIQLCFEKGIELEDLKKNTFLKQLVTNLVLGVLGISALTIINIQDILYNRFITLVDGSSLFGAGIIDITIKVCGYRIFSIFILFCIIKTINYLKKEKLKKAVIWLSMIPTYLVCLFIIMIGVDGMYIGSNELDKEKKYIEYNMEYTKMAYNLKIDEFDIENSGTITLEDVTKNEDVINNINILNKSIVLSHLEEYQNKLGFYTYPSTKIDYYNINGKDCLVYVSPREIVSNETRTYNNTTYEYTHGYGVIITSASKTDESGYLEYIKSGFIETDDGIILTQPRLYFGIQTNNTIVINKGEEKEYDYPITTTKNSYTTYDGTAGIKLNFIDRLILGIKEKKLKLALSTNVSNESTIIIKRNIIERAKTILPYLMYDENPYLIIAEDGKLYWILDAYTISNSYPYSQETTININNKTERINYIRNSVKVIIDAYNGSMKFYITDRYDPIVMAYWNLYPSLFEDLDENIPEAIASHIVYSEYLYSVQADILTRYHNIQPEVLYRTDDVWEIAKENTTKVSSVSGTEIIPYYTIVKTIDCEKEELGLVIPYTISGKQNITSYLVGTYDVNSGAKLKIYKFTGDTAILGTTQLDTLIEEDEKISKELENLNTSGTKIQKNIIVVPIDDTLIYVEPIYQVKLNEENQSPILKKIIVASGNKVAIGENLKQAIDNLLSQEAVSIKIETENINDLIEDIIEANKNLTESSKSNNWEFMGRDIANLQELIIQLEKATKTDD